MGDDENAAGRRLGGAYVKRLRMLRHSHPPKRTGQSAISPGQLSLKITDRCTMKLTVVATPWAMTNATTCTTRPAQHPARSAASNKHAEQLRPAVRRYRVQDHDPKEAAVGRRGPEGPAPVDQVRRRRAGDEGKALAGCARGRSRRTASRSPAGRSRRWPKPPVITNRMSWARQRQDGLSRSSTGNSSGCGNWWRVFGHRPLGFPARPVGRTPSIKGLDALGPVGREGRFRPTPSPSIVQTVGRSASKPCLERALGRTQADRGLGRDLSCASSRALLRAVTCRHEPIGQVRAVDASSASTRRP